MKRYPVILVILFVCLFFLVSTLSALGESLTYDEVVDVEEGLRILRDRKFVEPYNPPFIKALTAVPLWLGLDTYINSQKLAHRYLPARAVTILLGVATLLLTYNAAKRVWGVPQAIFTLFLLAFEPNVLGNSHYVTLDTGLMLLVLLAFMLLIRTFEKPTKVSFVTAGFAVGLAFASKISAIPFLALSAAAAFAMNRKRYLGNLKDRSAWIIASALVAFITVWATYFFTSDVVIADRSDEGRVSSRLIAYAKSTGNTLLESAVVFGKTKPVPLGNYIATLKNNVLRSGQEANIFFFGERYSSARWYFMPIMILLKTPLPLIALFAVGLVYGIKDVMRRRYVLLFFLPIVSILASAAFLKMSPWVRYVLPMYPFLAVVAGGSWGLFREIRGRIFLLILCAWYLSGTVTSFPHFISYANEFAGKEENRYKLFVDSNIDWGQSLPDLAEYIRKVKPSEVSFSYFGRDNADHYGLVSDFPYGSHKLDEMCRFHRITYPNNQGPQITVISVSNWYYCGYYKDHEYQISTAQKTALVEFMVMAQ